VGGFVCWQLGQRFAAGLWIGMAVLLKVTPGLLVLWLLLKREFRVAGVALGTVLLAGPVADGVVLGPRAAADAYRAWFRRSVTVGSHAGLIREQREMDWRNQSLSAVTTRWLHATDYRTHFDNDPRMNERFEEHAARYINVVNLPLGIIGRIVAGIAALSLLVLGWLMRKPAAVLTVWQLRFEWVLVLLAMLWLMPVMRLYHVIWAYPAIAVLGGAVGYAGFGSGWSLTAFGMIAAVLMGQLALLFRPAQAGGVVLMSVVLLAIPVVWMLVRLARDGALLPPDKPGPAAHGHGGGDG
jgi:hypothetical protein